MRAQRDARRTAVARMSNITAFYGFLPPSCPRRAASVKVKFHRKGPKNVDN
jgi:hypothetical protein